jgi:hypothetical protein
MSRSLAIGLVMLALAAPPAGGGGATYSGTVVSVDPAAGTLVLAHMGPWQGGEPERSLAQVRVATDGQTRVLVARRATGAAPDGWIGGFVETPASLREIRPGDFVAVELREGAAGRVADRITRVVTKD